MQPITLQDINRHLSGIYISRGRDYYQKGRVNTLEIYQQEQQLVASVDGSGRKTYQVIINLDTQDTDTLHDIRGHCSCPVGYNCKHVAAVLLKYINTTANQHQTAAAPIFAPPLQTWLDQLPATSPPTTLPEQKTSYQYELHYVLSIQQDEQAGRLLQAILYKTRRLKSRDGWSKGTKLWHVSHSNANFLTEQDKELAHLLESQSRSGYYHRHGDNILHGQVADYLLQKIVDTGRSHWDSMDQPLLKRGEARSGVLQWALQQQQLVVTIQEPAGLTLLPIPTPWYLDPATQQIGPLHTELSEPVIAALTQAPAVPIRQCQPIADALRTRFPKESLPLPEVDIQPAQHKIKPTPCLYLTSTETDYFFYTDEDEQDYAELLFRYNGHTVHPLDTQNTLLNQIDDHFEQITRHPQAEQRYQKILLKTGLRKIEHINLRDLNAHGLRHIHPQAETGWLDFVSEHIPKLRDQGWDISFDPKFRYNLVEPDDWYAELDAGTGEDWFNLALGVTIDGKPFNLLTTLVDFIQRERQAKTLTEFLNHAPDQELRLPLEDGRLLRVPFGKVQHIIETLVELYDPKALDAEGTLPISRFQAAQLNALSEANLTWGGEAGPRRLAQQLANFAGIQSVAPPEQLQANLRQYQQYGLNWLQFLREYGLSGILADDMGLGKTVQALAHLLVEQQAERTQEPSLVVAPTSLMVNWAREAKKFAPSLRILTLQGANRQTYFDAIPDYDLVLSTYPLLPRDSETLLAQHWHLLILDEAQHIKNPRSKVATIACKLQANHRLCLTGTPIENHLGELWSQFHFLMPGLLGDQKRFQHLFRKPIEHQGDPQRQKQLKQRLAPFILRREKAQVVQELPEKTEIISDVELSGNQQQLYETVRVAMHTKIRQAIDKKGIERSQIIILDALLKLRQICCDPRLLKMDAAKKVKESAKLERLMEIMPTMLSEGRRILLFSQFTSMLKLIEQALQEQSIAYVKLTGQTKDRATPIDQFQNGEVPLFLISLKAGGAGLNLTAADTVIHYDPWWNPAVERQATDRAHRIGQTNKVFVYKLITRNTVEEKISNLQQKKQALADALFDGKQSKTTLTKEDLQNLFEPLTDR